MKVLQRVNKHINKVNVYQPGRSIEFVVRELGFDESNVLKLASNESALGVSPLAKQAMKDAVDQVFLYPDSDAFELKKSLANYFSYEQDNFVIGSGSNEILVFLSQCFMAKGKSVVASEKTFIIYKILATIADCEFREVPMNGLTHNLDGLLKAIDETTSIVFICNPNNPTGTMVNDAEIAKFMAKIPDDVLVVFDEAYAEICLKQMPNTLQYVKQGRSVIILRTFSKTYGLAGLRVGYGIAAPELIAVLEKVRQPFNTTLIGQKAAMAALADKKFLKDSLEVYREAKSFIESSFDKLGIKYEPTVANFILFEVKNAQDVYQKLTERGIIVRLVAVYNLPNHLRVTFATRERNEHFIKVLTQLI